MVKPADEPAVALLRRDGLTLRVERDDVRLGALSAPGFEPTRGFELTRPAETGGVPVAPAWSTAISSRVVAADR